MIMFANYYFRRCVCLHVFIINIRDVILSLCKNMGQYSVAPRKALIEILWRQDGSNSSSMGYVPFLMDFFIHNKHFNGSVVLRGMH